MKTIPKTVWVPVPIEEVEINDAKRYDVICNKRIESFAYRQFGREWVGSDYSFIETPTHILIEKDLKELVGEVMKENKTEY